MDRCAGTLHHTRAVVPLCAYLFMVWCMRGCASAVTLQKCISGVVLLEAALLNASQPTALCLKHAGRCSELHQQLLHIRLEAGTTVLSL